MLTKSKGLVAEWEKNESEVIRVAFTKFNGRDIISLRVWYREKGSSNLRAGRNGLNIEVSHLPDLVRAVKKAKRRARATGLLGSQD